MAFGAKNMKRGGEKKGICEGKRRKDQLQKGN
jgi:hypothetical protein